MIRFFPWIPLVFALVVHTPLIACDAGTSCDKCASEPEMSWNPENRFVTDRLKRFYSLDDLIGKAYAANDMATAATLAAEYLELATVYRCNWNHGNAVHDANRFLGLMSVKSGIIDDAAQYLLKAGKSTGSPQLNTFGPELDLANELLKRGNVETVKQYLKDIKSFWRMDNGQVATWLVSIENGEKPELNRFAVQQPGTAQMLLFWLLLVWPILVVAGTLYVLRREISRKWTFGATALVCGYLALVIANVIVAYLMPRIIGGIDNAGAIAVSTLIYPSVAIGLLIPLLAIVGVSRFFVVRNAS